MKSSVGKIRWEWTGDKVKVITYRRANFGRFIAVGALKSDRASLRSDMADPVNQAALGLAVTVPA